MKFLINIFWLALECLWIFSSIVDIYFSPGALTKVIFLPTSFLYILATWGFILLILKMYIYRFKNRDLLTKPTFLATVFVTLWAAAIPLNVLYTHLTELVRLFGDREIIYTRFYHLNYNQLEVFIEGYQSQAVLGLLVIPLYLNWKKLNLTIKSKFITSIKFIQKFIKKCASKTKVSGYVKFFSGLYPLLIKMFVVLLIFTALAKLYIPKFEWVLTVSSEICGYLIALLLIGSAFLSKSYKLTRSTNKFSLLALTISLIVIVSSVFSSFSAIGKVVTLLFIICILYFLSLKDD